MNKRHAIPGADWRMDLNILIYAAFAGGLCSLIYAVMIATTVAYFEGDPTIVYPITLGLFMAAVGFRCPRERPCSDPIAGVVHCRRYRTRRHWRAECTGALPCLRGNRLFHRGGHAAHPCRRRRDRREDPPACANSRCLWRASKTVARAVTFDRLGVVIALLAFPTVLLPYLGILASALLIGLVNLSISAVVAWRFPQAIGPVRGPAVFIGALVGLALAALLSGPRRFWTFGGAALSRAASCSPSNRNAASS